MKMLKITKVTTIIFIISFSVSAQVQNLAIVINGLKDPGSISIVNINQPNIKKAVKNDIITIGSTPNDIQIQHNLAYVVNTYSNNIQIINLLEQNSAGEISVGSGTLPEKIAFINSFKAYVTCNGPDQVVVLNLNTKSVTSKIKVQSKPWGITIINKKAYVANSAAVTNWVTFKTTYGDSSVSVIDTTTDQVIKTIKVATNATEITTDGNSKVLVISTGDYAMIPGQLTIINANTDEIEKTVKLKTTPGAIIVNRKQQIAIINTATGAMVYDLVQNKLVRDKNNPIAEFSGGFGMTIDQEKSTYYVCIPDWTGGGLDELRVLNSKYNLVKRYQVGKGASFVAVAQIEGKNSIGVSEIKDLYQTTWGAIKHNMDMIK